MTENHMEALGLAVVTGASSGIGRSLAKEFVRRGFDVVIAAEDDEIHDAADELEASGRTVVPVQVDLSRADGVVTLYLEVQALGRPVDALALNAGIGVGGRFVETDLEDDLRLIDLNVRSTVHLAKLVAREMVARGEGRSLASSPIAATLPAP